MNNSLKELKKRIMRRIYLIFLVRNVAPFAFDCVVIIAIVFVASFFVSIRDVFTNMEAARAGGGLTRFSASAFFETELSTKFLFFALGIVGFLAMRHFTRALRAARLMREKK